MYGKGGAVWKEIYQNLNCSFWSRNGSVSDVFSPLAYKSPLMCMYYIHDEKYN